MYGVPLAINMSAGEVTAKLHEQAASSGSRILLNTTVSLIQRDGGGFVVMTSANTTGAPLSVPSGEPPLAQASEPPLAHSASGPASAPSTFGPPPIPSESCVVDSGKFRAKTIIITAGVGSFVPNKLGLPNENDFCGKSLFYDVTDIKVFANKRVVVVGGGNAAVDWALELSNIATFVDLVHRRKKFRCNQATFDLLSQRMYGSDDENYSSCGLRTKNVRIHVPFRLSSLEGSDGVMTGARLEAVDGVGCDADELFIEADYLLIFCGLVADVHYMQNWGVLLENQKIPVNETCETNVPGMFAAGDVVSYPNKLNILAVGFGEAAKAAYAAKRYLDTASALSD
jgi:thioredoxin reductase